MAAEKKLPAKPTNQERRSSQSGIKSGGRRKSDRKLVDAGSKGRIWIALSFGLSACILAWAFSLPFRGNEAMVSFGDSEAPGDPLDAKTVRHASKATTNEQYVQSMLQLDRELKMQLAAKYASPKNLPGQAEAKHNWRKRLKKQVQDVKLLTESAGGKVKKGTIEWDAQRDLQEFLQDAPEQ